MNYKLLVAEPSSAERLTMCHALNQYFGHALSLVTASDGVQALDLFCKERPDIAVLNIDLPLLSGFDVAQQIRNSERHCALLFISDFDDFSYAKQAIDLRALDYILKPYQEEKLIQSVKEAMQYASHHNMPMHEVIGVPVQHWSMDNLEHIRLSVVRRDISNYIQAHYMEELSMKNVAHAMNYSDAYFCKLFKQCFQVTFSTYLNTFRVEKAKSMMEGSRINVKEIGRACGYADPNYFSRVFRQITGFTPTQYRMAIREKN